MREWNLKTGDPISLTLSADARISQTDYFNDQTWELSLGEGEPQALAIQTSFGLRARSLRLFPRFSEDGLTITNPSDFVTPPSIQNYYPNYLSVHYSPFADLEVRSEYWIPHSQAAAGRLHLINQTQLHRLLRLDWVAILMIAGNGEPMGPAGYDNVHVLAGKTGGVTPVVFMTGGPQASTAPYPSLTLNLDLDPNQEYILTWTIAALQDSRASFDAARNLATKNWEAESARIELLNSGDLEIYTGDPDWDAAFWFSQKTAYRLFFQATQFLDYPSFVLTRQPDQGFSIRGDGADYNHSWNGQTPLDAYYMCSLLLPSAPDMAQGLLLNFLCSSSTEGFIDWKTGLGGQRSQLLATPLLANLAFRIYQCNEDVAFLKIVYPPLLEFIRVWFNPQHDRDGDGIPEWDHAFQAGFDDHPLFAPWVDWSQGADISTAESPGLCALLYSECQALIQIAKILDSPEAIPGLEALADNLRTAVEISWDPELSIYRYWDRDSHFCTMGEILGQRIGSGEIQLDRHFDNPIRLLLRLQAVGEATRPIRAFIHGTSQTGQHIIEPIPFSQWEWHQMNATATGERIYSQVEHVLIEGLNDADQVIAQTVSYIGEDYSLLLPLWAGIPAKERAQELVGKTITNSLRFWQECGISTLPHTNIYRNQFELVFPNQIYMPWNLLIGEGLLAYGYQRESADLVTRLMKAIIQTLKKDGSFRKYYHPDFGNGIGDPNSLEGLAPVSLFLDCLGVKVISRTKVFLQGINPFPWPVTVKYRGLTIFRQLEKSIVIFPNGATITVNDPSPCIVSLDKADHQ